MDVRKKRTIGIAGIAAILLVAIAGYAIQWTMGHTTPKVIPTDVVRRGRFVVSITEVGEMRALNAQPIVGPFWGRIAWLVPEGTVVQAGDPVLKMDRGEIENNVQRQKEDFALAKSRLEKKNEQIRLSLFQKEMDVRGAEANLERVRLELEDAQDQYEKEQELFRNKMTSKEAAEGARLRVSGAALNLNIAEMDLERAQRDQASNEKIQQEELRQAELAAERAEAELNESKSWLESATVRSPGPGMIVYLTEYRIGSGLGKVQEGDQVWGGKNLLEIPDLSEMTVVMKVNEMDISRVQIGQRALVRVDAFPGMLLHGTVIELGSLDREAGTETGASRQSEGEGINVFTATVQIDKEDLNGQQMVPALLDTSRGEVDLETNPIIRQGMTASVDIVAQEYRDVLHVPLEAVFRKDEGYVVFVMEKGMPTERTVELGAKNESDVIVVRGTQEGDVVCLQDPTGKLGGPAQWASSPTSEDTRPDRIAKAEE